MNIHSVSETRSVKAAPKTFFGYLLCRINNMGKTR